MGISPANLEALETRIAANQLAHHNESQLLTRLHYSVGIPSVILSTVGSSALLASIGSQFSSTGKIIIATIGLIAAVLTALQTFLNASKRSEQHRIAAARLGSARRSIESFTRRPPASEKEWNERMTEIENLLNKISEEAPPVRIKDRDRSLLATTNKSTQFPR
jgi:hypothetical protein